MARTYSRPALPGASLSGARTAVGQAAGGCHICPNRRPTAVSHTHVFAPLLKEPTCQKKSWSAKREREYEYINDSLLERGKGEQLAAVIAARTVNKERAQHGACEEESASSINDMPSSWHSVGDHIKVRVGACWLNFATTRRNAP